MKSILNLFILFFVLNVFAQKNMDTIYGNPKSVRMKVELFDDVKRAKVKIFELESQKSPKNITSAFIGNWTRGLRASNINCYIVFLKNGKKDYETWYDNNDEIDTEYYYKYDKNENLVETKELLYDDVYYLTRYFYNKSNLLISQSCYWSDDSNDFIHWYYTRGYKGKIIGVNSFDEYGSRRILTFEIDSLKNSIKEYHQKKINYNNNNSFKIKDSIGNKFLMKKRMFDVFENKIYEERWIEENSKKSYKTIYRYDDRNNIIYQGNIKDTLNSYFKFRYNSNNLKTYYEHVNIKQPNSNDTLVYRYNDKNLIKHVKYSGKDYYGRKRGHVLDFKYKFDRKGNWIKITKIVNGEPLYVWTRKIKYY